jgi:hypothetical protein
MKKLILLGFAVILITSCQNNAPQRYMSSSPEIDVTKTLIKDYENGNWENWETHYADTAKIFHNTNVGITPKELQEGLKNTLEYMSSYHFNDKEMYVEMIIDDKDEEWVYFWGTWEAKVADTDIELAMPVHIALRYVNNKVVREYAYYDPVAINTAIMEIEAAILEEEVEEVLE